MTQLTLLPAFLPSCTTLPNSTFTGIRFSSQRSPQPYTKGQYASHPLHSFGTCMTRVFKAQSSLQTPTTTTTERILWASNLSKSHDGATFLFRDQSVTLQRGHKIGLIGPNSAGKSTLMHILCGIVPPDSGTVSVRKGVVSALVAQSIPSDLDTSLTVTSAVLQLASCHAPTAPIRAALRHAYALSAVANAERDSLNLSEEEHTAKLKLLAKAAAEMDTCDGAWGVDSLVASLLDQLGLPADAVVSNLSGGQKRRLGIAAALAAKPDILFLDEVTNHLSIDGIQFLESYLSDPSLTVLAISHDRAFINAVCTTAIWELDSGELHRHSAPYDAFIAEKDARLAADARKVYVMQKAFAKQLEWLRRQPKARSTKNRSRIDDAKRLEEDLRATKNRNKRRAIGVQELKVSSARLGGDIVSLHDVTIRRGTKIIVEGMNYTFERGERVGIVGFNGVGKSSLMRVIAGLADADKGEVHVGETVVFGYFDQEGIDLTARLSEASAATHGVETVEEMRLFDYVSELLLRYGEMPTNSSSSSSQGSSPLNNKNASHMQQLKADEAYVRLTGELERLNQGVNLPARYQSNAKKSGNQLRKMTPIGLLDHFGFARDRMYGMVRHLSGGEKRRLQLLGLLLKSPNFLILDEVSNDLDVNTLTMVEDVLDDYGGVLVLCSHDRFMLDRLVDHLLVMDGHGRVRVVEGKFSEFLEDEKEAKQKQREESMKSVNKDEARRENTKNGGKRKLSFKERKEYERLEGEIEKYQEEYDALCQQLSAESQDVGYEKTVEWSERIAQLEQLVHDKTERWLHLAELEES